MVLEEHGWLNSVHAITWSIIRNLVGWLAKKKFVGDLTTYRTPLPPHLNDSAIATSNWNRHVEDVDHDDILSRLLLASSKTSKQEHHKAGRANNK